MSDPGDLASGNLPWPDAYAGILPVLREEWGVKDEIYLTRQLGGGKSGALVFFVDIATKAFTGQAILKLERSADAGSQQEHEAARLDRAIADAPEFAAKHLPRIIHAAHRGDQFAILSTIAGRGLEYIEPWAESAYERKLESAGLVSSDLLENWNGKYCLSAGMKTPQQLLQSWLLYRLDPARGGRIHALLGEDFGISPQEPAFVVDGIWFPNPLAFAENLTLTPKRLRLRGALGHCHGDLHGLNLLVSRKHEGRLDYDLIDLALYESDQYLFYDHAYFELSTLLSERGQATGQNWEALIAQLCRFGSKEELPELRTDHIGLIQLVKSFRQGVTDWIQSHEPDRRSFMESQMLLARVAAGLMISHRYRPLEPRQMAFFYAAANLRDYVKLHRLDWPKTGPALKIGAKAARPAKDWPASSPLRGQSPVRQLGAAGLAAGLIVGAMVFAGDVRSWWSRGTMQTERPSPVSLAATETKTSLAVLPFENLSPDGDDGFADGLSIDIANVFEQTGAFRMPGTTSAFQFKGKRDSSRTIGEALNVDYLVEGTVWKGGEDLRIVASLIRAEDNFPIWSRTFHEKIGDVFVAQEKIAEDVGAALATPIDIDADILEAQRTDNPRAYELFVRGLALFELRGRNLLDAIDVLEQATEMNPDFAAAWGALSLAYNKVPNYLKEVHGRLVDPVVYYRKSTAAAMKGEAIDLDLPLVRHAVAVMYQRERQWIAAQDEYEAAIRDDPMGNQIKADYARLLYIVGRRTDALAQIDRAMELDPLVPAYRLWSTVLRLQADPTEENAGDLEDVFRRFPNLREFALRYIIDYRANAGQLDQARELVTSCSDCSLALRNRALGLLEAASAEPAETVFAKYKDDNLLGYDLIYDIGGAELTLDAFHYYALGSKRRYGFHMVPWTRIGELSQYERFLNIAADIGLVAYWRERGYPDRCIVKNERLVCAEGGS